MINGDAVMKITITDDFDQEKIRISGQAFRIDLCDDGSYRYIHRGKVLHLKQTGKTEYEADCTKKEWDSIWSEYFDLNRNYKKIRNSIDKNDEFLLNSSKAGKGIRILKQDPFEMLITFIISQRKNIPAIKASVEKICTYFGKEIKTKEGNLYAFPTAEELYKADESLLTKCSLGYRLPYILDATRRVYEKDMDLKALTKLSDEELFEELKRVHGVGDKVANCICLFGYGRTGMAPVDTWIKKVIDEQYGGENPFAGYGENAGIMQQYMFYYARIQ